MSERRIVLHYPRTLIDQPIVSTLVKKFDLTVNILRASILPDQEGVMVVGLEGTEENVEKGVAWVEEQGVRVQALSVDVVRDDDVCTQCGHCIVVCPTGALRIDDRESQYVIFDTDECIACELCVAACPPRAMKVRL